MRKEITALLIAITILFLAVRFSPFTTPTPSYNISLPLSFYETAAGKSLGFSPLIQNIASDKEDHVFVLSITPLSASSEALSRENCLHFGWCTHLQREMTNWIAFDQSARFLPYGDFSFYSFTIEPPAYAPSGLYLYTVVACYDTIKDSVLSSTECTRNSPNKWGEQHFFLKIS